MKKTLAFVVLALALLPLTVSAAEAPTVAVAAAATPAQPDVALALGIPSPREVSTCSDICIADFKICRDSCRSLACYYECRAAYDRCIAGC